MALATVGNRRQLYISAWIYQSNHNLFKRIRKCFYDAHKRLDDVEVEQVVLKISFLIWEMYQSDRNISYYKRCWKKLCWL